VEFKKNYCFFYFLANHGGVSIMKPDEDEGKKQNNKGSDGIDSDDERFLDELQEKESGQGITLHEKVKIEIKQETVEPQEFQNYIEQDVEIKNEEGVLGWAEMKVELKEEELWINNMEKDPLEFL
jgi:hypothetical protein